MEKIGLVLGSGGFRGPAHVGVLARLRDLGIPIHAMVGCSVGALVSAYYAAVGLAVEDLMDHAFGVSAPRVVSHGLSMRFPRICGPLLGRWADPIHRRLDLLTPRDFRTLHHGVEKIGFLTYDLVRQERIFVATGRERGFTLSEAVRASARLPYLFPPLRKEADGLERHLVDGGLAAPTPVRHAVAAPISATHVIAVNLSESRSRTTYSELDRFGALLGERLIVLRPQPRGFTGLRGGRRYVEAWYRAGWDSIGTEEAARMREWTWMETTLPAPVATGAAEMTCGGTPECREPGSRPSSAVPSHPGPPEEAEACGTV